MIGQFIGYLVQLDKRNRLIEPGSEFMFVFKISCWVALSPIVTLITWEPALNIQILTRTDTTSQDIYQEKQNAVSNSWNSDLHSVARCHGSSPQLIYKSSNDNFCCSGCISSVHMYKRRQRWVSIFHRPWTKLKIMLPRLSRYLSPISWHE